MQIKYHVSKPCQNKFSHKQYLDHLREKKDKVTKARVVEYVNDLHPSKLMFSLNYPMRKRQVDSIVADEPQ